MCVCLGEIAVKFSSFRSHLSSRIHLFSVFGGEFFTFTFGTPNSLESSGFRGHHRRSARNDEKKEKEEEDDDDDW